MKNDPHQPGQPHAQLEPYDDPEPGSLWFISLAGTIILVALVVAISAINFNTERHEAVVKSADRTHDAEAIVPTSPITAAAYREKSSALDGMLDRGEIGKALYIKSTQQTLLQTWMRYERIDSKDQKQVLVRIPVSEAMKIIAAEYAPKAGPKRAATEGAGDAVAAAAPTLGAEETKTP